MASRRRSSARGWAIVAVLCVAGGWYAIHLATRSAETAIAEENAKLRKLGYPTTPSELRARLAVDPDQNAADLLRRASEAWVRAGSPNPLVSFGGAKVPEADAARYVRLTDSVFRFLKEASQKKFNRVDIHWEDPTVDVPPSWTVRGIFACLARAQALGWEGDKVGALDQLDVGYKLAQLRQTFLMDQVQGAHSSARVLNIFNRLLSLYLDDPEFIAAARTWYERLPPLQDRQRALDSEIVALNVVVPRLNDSDVYDRYVMPTAGFDAVKFKAGTLPRIMRRRVHANVLRLICETLEEPYVDPWQDVARWSRLGRKIEADRSIPGEVTWVLIGRLGSLGRQYARTATHHRLTDVAIWLAERRIETGEYPTVLPEGPRFLDPWTQKPYVYFRTETGFKLYSVGPNQVDDGGDRPPEGRRTDDVAIVIPVPAR